MRHQRGHNAMHRLAHKATHLIFVYLMTEPLWHHTPAELTPQVSLRIVQEYLSAPTRAIPGPTAVMRE